MDNSETIMRILTLIMALVVLLIVIAIPVGIFLAIKHLIRFTTRTICEEKARAEDRHRQDYNPERDR